MRQPKNLIELLKMQRNMGMKGPKKEEIKRFRVNTFENYLDVCNNVANSFDSSVEVYFRGQEQEYLLPGSDEIDLRPSGGRKSTTILSEPSDESKIAYRCYWHSVAMRHLKEIGLTKNSISALMGLFPNPSKPLAIQDKQVEKYASNSILFLGSPLSFLIGQFNECSKDPIRFEATLQHYGFPTLYLDVTLSPLVALFFATHKLRPDKADALKSRINDKVGIVYILVVSPRKIDCLPDYKVASVALAPLFPLCVDLYDIFYDNDTRPRRQGAALLTEVGHCGCKKIHQLNAYSEYINCAIEIAPQFYKDSDAKKFLNSLELGRLFPGISIDCLYRNLRRTDTARIKKYTGHKLSEKDPLGKLEWLTGHRILLVGSEAQSVQMLLAFGWLARKNAIEVVSMEQAKELLQDKDERIDLVLICEPNSEEVRKISKILHQVARDSLRISGFISSTNFFNYVPKSKESELSSYTLIRNKNGDLFNLMDSRDTVLAHEKLLLDMLLHVSKLRYRRWLKGCQNSWRDFINWSSTMRTF